MSCCRLLSLASRVGSLRASRSARLLISVQCVVEVTLRHLHIHTAWLLFAASCILMRILKGQLNKRYVARKGSESRRKDNR